MEGKIETLDRLEALNKKLVSINNWIKNNPHEKEPNINEIVGCWCEYGECLQKLRAYYDQNGYPAIMDNSGNFVRATHYDIWKLDPESKNCSNALAEMEQLRNLNNHEFFKNTVTNEFLTELKYRVTTGEYDTPKNPTITAMKKELLCKIISVPFYIWQTKKNEPDYQYDNGNEWMMIQEYFQHYKDEVGVQTISSEKDNDGNTTIKYAGPQFGQHIENALKEIEKVYKFNQSPIKK